MAERHKLLLESPTLQEEKLPKRTTQSSTESGYILSITALPAFYAASTSAPFNIIDIFDKGTLEGVQTLSGHEGGTTSLHTVRNLGGIVKDCLISSGKDGSVKLWDERTNSHSIKMTNLGKAQALLCCDVSPDGLTVAAGTEMQGEEASILYWDARQPATPLRSHNSTHSDDITTLSFSTSNDPETNTHLLLSGSTDGLLSLSNPDEDDEDEAPLQVGNWGCSISQAGWIYGESGTNVASIWAASDMETFSTWKSDLDQLMSLDIRSPVLHQRRTWVTDYLITATSTKASRPNLAVFTGSNEGDIAMLSNMNTSVPDAPWCLHKLWTHGHQGVVRSMLWDQQNQTIITGGEDGKLNSWSCTPLVEESSDSEEESDGREPEDDSDAMEVDPSSKNRKRDSRGEGGRKGKRARRL